MSDFLKENKEKNTVNIANSAPSSLSELFLRAYAPYKISGFVSEPRQDVIEMREKQKTPHSTLIATIEKERSKDPMVGAKYAGHEIVLNMIRVLNNDKGVHFEALFSGLGCLGGYECSTGLIHTLKCVILNQADQLKYAGAVGMLIAETTGGEHYLMGDRVGNEFLQYYQNAMNDPCIKAESLLDLSSFAAMNVGKPQFWQTKYDNVVQTSPKEIVDTIRKIGFEQTFSNYCRYPHERLIACALAAREAIEYVQKGMNENKNQNGTKENAGNILKEYGWRTSHYIWNSI